MIYTIEGARAILTQAGVFLIDADDPKSAQTLVMNGVWEPATADREYVSDDELPEVARLFFQYGWFGLMYWVSEKRGHARSASEDLNRCIEFVRSEERMKATG